MAASFVTASDGHGGTLITEALSVHQFRKRPYSIRHVRGHSWRDAQGFVQPH
jgi:hypothetical protein